MSQISDLLLQGPRSARDLCQHLAISQPTFSRLVTREEKVIQFGKARAVRYALVRPVRGIATVPLWRVDEAGQAHKFADIYPCWPQGSCMVVTAQGEEAWFDGLPWYLTDLRPQGFLGRAWGRSLAAQLDLPEDIRLWQEDEILYALTMFNGEYTGGWLVGESNYQRWITSNAPRTITREEKLTAYEQLADNALAGEIVGSSAGGEQPKFTCYAQTSCGEAHVLVKFSVPQESALARRWGDLLIAESVALAILRDAGISACTARTSISPAGQVFLESERFDCIDIYGRRPVVSLEAVQSEFISPASIWPDAMRRLAKQGKVAPESVLIAEKIWAFGRLITNSDMHAGNLSFYFSAPPLVMAPVYDMLPMAFAPNSAGMMRDAPVDIKFDATVSREAWQFALPLAQTFWQTVAADEQVSVAFRAIAAQMPDKLRLISETIARMAT